MIKNIILLGKPGSGKGTFAVSLAKNSKFIHISTGDIFRREIKNKTDLGIKVSSILATGEYVSDEITNEIVKREINSKIVKQNGFLLDGFPRTICQAKFLDSICNIDYVIHLIASDDIIIERLNNRYLCEKNKHIFNTIFNPPKVAGICDIDGSKLKQRNDDSPKMVKQRLLIYKKQTQPLIDYYNKQGKIIPLNSESQDISKIIDEFYNEVRLANN